MRFTSKLFIAICMLLVILMSACASPTSSTSTVTDTSSGSQAKDDSDIAAPKKITAKEAEELMKGDVLILDVRTKEEYDEGHIPDAILLTDSDIPSRASEVIDSKDQRLLVYCRSGVRSAEASQQLVELGYTDVYDFGGIIDWHGDVVK